MTPPGSPTTARRFHYMDNLRAIAMTGGIFFHAALAYSPLMREVWPMGSDRSVVALDAIAWFSHLFRMPLFFVIAGFFAAYLIEKRGAAGLLKNRARRILLPFVLFLPLVWGGFAIAFGWAISHVEQKSAVLALIAESANNPDAPPPEATTTHLWFLYNLCFFYVAYVGLRAVGLFRTQWFSRLVSPAGLLFIVPLLIWPAIASQPYPHPAPEQFIPQAWSFGFFGVFFMLGALMFERHQAIEELSPYALGMTVAAVVAYGVVYWNFPGTVSLEAAIAMHERGLQPPPAPVGIALLEAISATYMTTACLVFGRNLLDRVNRPFRFIADSSYWVYIIHLPVLFWIQFWLLDVDLNPWFEFGISSFATLAVGFVTYVLFVRWTPIGWLLNGRRQPMFASDSSS